MIKILVIAEKQTPFTIIKKVLTESGYDFTIAGNTADVFKKCREFKYDIIIADTSSSVINGIEFTNEVLKLEPELTVILLDTLETKKSIIETKKKGIFDCLTGPVSEEQLLLSITRAVEKINLLKENTLLKYKLETIGHIERAECEYLTSSEKMIEILKSSRKIAASDSTILITGAKGTGKEVFAKYIYINSTRRNHPFIQIKCAEKNGQQLESELFGNVKGTFNDGVNDKKGYFELAHNGTIYIDEIGDVSLQAQLMILKAIKEKQFSKIGDTKVQFTNARVIASTNKNLFKLVNEGKFNENLYYILSEFEFHLPSVRNSPDDIMFYFERFVEEFAKQKKKTIKTIDENVIDMLVNYNWPGNISEIKNIAERVTILCENETITTDLLPVKFIIKNKQDVQIADYSSHKEIIIRNFEVNFIGKYLRLHNGNVAATARAINFHPVSLRQKLAKLGIQPAKIKYN